MRDFLELLGLIYMGMAAAMLIVVLLAATWINLKRKRAAPGPRCALCTAPADDIPAPTDEPWYCSPCAFAIAEARAIYHRGRSSPA